MWRAMCCPFLSAATATLTGCELSTNWAVGGPLPLKSFALLRSILRKMTRLLLGKKKGKDPNHNVMEGDIVS